MRGAARAPIVGGLLMVAVSGWSVVGEARADGHSSQVRATAGRVFTVAGGGHRAPVDGILATDADLFGAVPAVSGGTLWIRSGPRLFRLGSDGRLHRERTPGRVAGIVAGADGTLVAQPLREGFLYVRPSGSRRWRAVFFRTNAPNACCASSVGNVTVLADGTILALRSPSWGSSGGLELLRIRPDGRQSVRPWPTAVAFVAGFASIEAGFVQLLHRGTIEPPPGNVVDAELSLVDGQARRRLRVTFPVTWSTVTGVSGLSDGSVLVTSGAGIQRQVGRRAPKPFIAASEALLGDGDGDRRSSARYGSASNAVGEPGSAVFFNDANRVRMLVGALGTRRPVGAVERGTYGSLARGRVVVRSSIPGAARVTVTRIQTVLPGPFLRSSRWHPRLERLTRRQVRIRAGTTIVSLGRAIGPGEYEVELHVAGRYTHRLVVITSERPSLGRARQLLNAHLDERFEQPPRLQSCRVVEGPAVRCALDARGCPAVTVRSRGDGYVFTDELCSARP